ncbi:hypothetical protein [Vibrio gazogenes]|uniref:Uncharacterized protein n=1 Tax=Vibrio gazogenes TaxID=687 RepID=A0A1Z2SID9_VIBGA|nr:hypothetical protein [Vibrio gazogenes]ASA56958.1 hypothetical protein BSQ33_15475 [Vibrio gazogenes]
MRLFFILFFLAASVNAYTCDDSNAVQFQSNYLIKSVYKNDNLTKEKKVWNYFVFPNGDLMLIKQDICFMKEFYIDYYYSLSSDRKTVLNNYKNILNQLLQSELLTIRHGDLYSYLSKKIQGKKLDKKFILEKSKRDDTVDSYFNLNENNEPSIYKYSIKSYIGIGGL